MKSNNIIYNGPLSTYVEIISGGTPRTSNREYWGGNIPWLSVKDFNNDKRFVYKTEKCITKLGLENSVTQLLRKNDIIISARGTVGAMAMIPFPMSFNQSCYGIRAKERYVHPSFLYYLLKSMIVEFKANTHGSVFDTITRETFDNINIYLPSLEIQDKIAYILARLDDKIELNDRVNDNLEEQAQEIFKSWFINFSHSRKNELERTRYGIKPQKWSFSSLLDIAQYINGLAMQNYRPTGIDNGIPVLKIKELRQGICDSNSELCASDIDQQFIINDGDVIFSWSGSLLIDFWCGGKCGLNQHLFKVISKNYDKWFYYAWTKYHLNEFIGIAKDKATTMGHIKREHLKNALVLIPDKDDYEEIGDMMRPLYDSIISNRITNMRLGDLRDSILPKLMSGEIDVSKIKI